MEQPTNPCIDCPSYTYLGCTRKAECPNIELVIEFSEASANWRAEQLKKRFFPIARNHSRVVANVQEMKH